MFTPQGQEYQERQRSFRGIDDAEMPLSLTTYELFTSLRAVARWYGPGVMAYFSFINWLIGYNVMLSVCGIFSWILFLRDPAKTWPFQFDDFFVSNYIKGSSDAYWFYPSLITIGLWLLLGPGYYLIEWLSLKSFKKKQLQLYFQKGIQRSNNHIASFLHKRDYFLSSMVTLFAIVVSGSFYFALLCAQKYVSLNYATPLIIGNVLKIQVNTLMTIPVSVSFVLCNMIWGKISLLLTIYEHNNTWTQFCISRALKLIIFKVASACLLFSLAAIILNPTDCLTKTSSLTFITTLLIDIFILDILFETIIPAIKQFRSPLPQKPEFNISIELQRSLYRQFIIHLAFFCSPMTSLLGLLSFVLQYFIDRIRLRYISKDPHVINNALGYFIMLYAFIIALFSFFVFPNGGLWMLFTPQYLPASYQNCSMTNAIYRI